MAESGSLLVVDLPLGAATLVTFGNGRTLDKAYDANYGIAAIADSAVDGLALDYTLDAVGNVTGLDERLAGGGTTTRSIDYDDLDRLTGLKDGATPIQAFTYDATGNRTSKTAGSPEAYTYPTTSHRLTQTGATARGYDAAGNTTAIGSSRVFTYDDRGRMSQLTDGGVLTREYGYNARGERVVKRNPTVTGGDIVYVYDEAGKLLGEYDEAGTRIKEYVWLDDTLVAVLSSHGGSSHQYVLTDHLGTPRAVVHPGTNAILWRWDLTGSAFGDHAANEDPDGDSVANTFNLRYPGQYFDEETGLHYNYFRDYDPSAGRYVQSDPIGLSGGISTYGYVAASPLLLVDSFGLQSRDLATFFREPPPMPQVGAHHSDFVVPVCLTSSRGCSRERAFAAMRNFSAPGAPYAESGAHDRTLTGGYPIRQFVDPCAMTITNVTREGHRYGGSVAISIVERDGFIGVRIVSSGVGPRPIENALLGPPLFTYLAISAAINLGGRP
jgi:RHS repeat-associated protein